MSSGALDLGDMAGGAGSCGGVGGAASTFLLSGRDAAFGAGAGGSDSVAHVTALEAPC